MDRLQDAISVARFITRGFFSEVMAQFSSPKSSVIEEGKMTLSELKDKISEDAKNAGEAVGYAFDHEFEVARLTKMVQIGDCYVYLRIYKNRVERVMKKPRPNYFWETTTEQLFERVALQDYTPDIAHKEKMDFSMAGAIEFTKRELCVTTDAGPVLKEGNSVSEADFLSSATPPQKWEINRKNQQVNNDPGVVKITKGKVIFAGEEVVNPQGIDAYTTFTVILKTADGSDVKCSGVELEKLFLAGKFSVEDNVVLKKRVETFSKELGGVTRNGVRNSYEVEII